MKHIGMLKKVSLVGVGNLLNAGFGLVFLAAAAKALPVQDFGRYAFLTSLLVFMSKIVDFGSNSIFVAESLKVWDIGTLVKRFYTLKTALFTIAVFISCVFLYVLGYRSLSVYAIFLVGLLFYSINVLLFAIFQSLEMFTHAVLLNTIPALLKAIVGVVILSGLYFSAPPELFLGVFCLSMGLCAILYCFIPREYRFTNHKLSLRDNVGFMLTSCTPAGIAQLISQGWSAIANMIVKVYKGYFDVGVFYLADKVANVFSLISLSIFTVILPQNAKRKRENIPHDYGETVLLSLIVMVLAFVFVAIAGIFLQRVFGDKYSGSLLILDVLIFSSAFSAIHAFMENHFYVYEDVKIIMHIAVVKLVAFISLSLLLVPLFSLKGLAFAQLLASVIGLLIISLSTYKLLRSSFVRG